MDRGDKMWRMRWFMDYLTSRFQELYEVNGNVSIDESMVKFKGRLAFRQYLPNKPIKWGVKLWVLAESTTGYCTGFQVYTGREENLEGKGLAHRVVMDLARPYYGSHACVYMDNYYTSVELLEEMKTVGLNGCGTVRANKKGLPPLEFLTNGVELDRHEYRVAQKDDLTFCVWQDTKMVMVLSNHHDPQATGTVNRRPEGYKQREALKKQPGFKRVGNRSYQHFKQTEVIVPAALSDYQKHMKGVDLLDQMIGYYGFQHRSKKWWRRVFWFLLGVSCYNAYIAARSSGGPVFKKKYPGYKDWLEDLAGELIHDCTTRSYPVTPPPPPVLPPMSGTSAPRHDFGKIYMKRKLCRECAMLPEHERVGRGPTIHGCKQCDQPLHMECMGKHYRRFWYWPSGDNPPAIEASPSKKVRRRLQAEFEEDVNKERCKSPRGKGRRGRGRPKSPKPKDPDRIIVRRGPRKPKPLPPPRKSSTRSCARLARARLRIRSDSHSDSDSAASEGNSAAGSDYDPGSPSNSAPSPDAPDSPSESLAPPSPSANSEDEDVGTVPTSSSTLELPSTSSTSPPSSPAPNPTTESLAVPSPGSNPNAPTSPAPSPPLASVAPASPGSNPTIPTISSSEPSTPQTANPTSNAPLDSLAKPSPSTQNTSATSSSTSTSSSSSTTAPQSTPSATNGHALSPSLEFQARPASRNQPTPVRVHDYSLPEKCDPDRRHTPLPYNLPRMSPATVTACHSIHNYSVNFKEGVDPLNPERATESPFLSPSAIGIAFLPSESTDLQGAPSNSKRGTRTPKKATPRKATPKKTPATPRKATPKKATPSKAKGSTASPSAYYSNPPFSPSESMAPPTYPTFSWTSLLSPGSPYSSHGPESPAEPMGPPSPRPLPPYANSQWGSRSPAYSRSPSPSMSRLAPPQNPYYPYTSNPPSESMPPPAPASHSTFPTSSWTSEMHSTPATTPYYSHTSNPASESTAPPSLGPTFPPNASGPARGGTARRSRKRFKGGDSDRLQARQSTEEPQTSSKLQWTPTSSWPSVRPMSPTSAASYYSRGSNRSDDRHMVYKKFKMTSPPAQYYSQASNPASESQASTSTSTSGRSPPSTTPQSSNASNTADLAPPSPDSPPTFHVMLPAGAFAEDNEENARFS